MLTRCRKGHRTGRTEPLPDVTTTRADLIARARAISRDSVLVLAPVIRSLDLPDVCRCPDRAWLFSRGEMLAGLDSAAHQQIVDLLDGYRFGALDAVPVPAPYQRDGVRADGVVIAHLSSPACVMWRVRADRKVLASFTTSTSSAEVNIALADYAHRAGEAAVAALLSTHAPSGTADDLLDLIAAFTDAHR